MKEAGPAVPDLVLERLHKGELGQAEAASLRERIEKDAALRARFESLAASDAQILEAVPPARFAAEVQSRLRESAEGGVTPISRPLSWLRHPAMAFALLAAVTAGGAAVARLRGPLPEPEAADRLKGGSPGLLLFRKSEAAAEPLAPGAVAHPTDVVQVVYRAGGLRFGTILSVDGRGAVTVHLPAAGQKAAPLQPEPTALSAAYRLDDAPQAERFYFVGADVPFGLEPVLEAARRAGADPLAAERLALGDPFVQTSFLLRKE